MLRVRNLAERTPDIPPSIQYAVREWARNWGRDGTIEWHPVLSCPVVKLVRRGDDPARAVDNPDADVECIALHEPYPGLPGRMRALNIWQLGPSGVIAWLDQRNMWSGRGEVSSPDQLVKRELDEQQKNRAEKRKAVREVGEEAGWLHRRSLLNIPYHTVGIDLKETE